MKRKIMETLKLTKLPESRKVFNLAFSAIMCAQMLIYCILPVMCFDIDIYAVGHKVLNFIFNFALRLSGIVLLAIGAIFTIKGSVHNEQGDISKGLGYLAWGIGMVGAGFLIPQFLGFSSLDSISFE